MFLASSSDSDMDMSNLDHTKWCRHLENGVSGVEVILQHRGLWIVCVCMERRCAFDTLFSSRHWYCFENKWLSLYMSSPGWHKSIVTDKRAGPSKWPERSHITGFINCPTPSPHSKSRACPGPQRLHTWHCLWGEVSRKQNITGIKPFRC